MASRFLAFLGFAILVASLITLNVAKAAPDPFKISDVSIKDKSASVEATIESFEETKIKSNVTFYHTNDLITYTIKLENTTDKAYTIDSIMDDNTNSYLSYTYSTHSGETIAAGASLDLDVTVTYKNSIPTPASRTQNLDVKFSFTYQEAVSEQEEEITVPNTSSDSEDIATPETGANTQSNANGTKAVPVAVFIAIAGFIIMVIGVVRSKKLSSHTKALAFVIFGSLMTASVANAVSSESVFSFETNYTLKNLLAISYSVDGVDYNTVINYGDTLTVDEPTKPGSNFAGWQLLNGDIVSGTQEISDDISIVATWTPITYTVSIDTDGDGTADVTEELDYGESITLPTNEASNPGYTPNGWIDNNGNHYDDAAEISNLTTEDGATITISPDFTPNNYTITLYTGEWEYDDATDNWSERTVTIDMVYGLEETLPNNNADEDYGYLRNGWIDENDNHYDDGEAVKNLVTDPDGNIEIYPDWTPIHYTVQLDLDGDGTIDETYNFTYDETEVILPANNNQKTGFTPYDWTTNEGQRVSAYTDIGALWLAHEGETITLSPNWRENRYSIIYDMNSSQIKGGWSGCDMQNHYSILYTQEVTLNPSCYTASSYNFAGWSTTANGEVEFVDQQSGVSRLTPVNNKQVKLYAQWTPKTYHITYDYDGGVDPGNPTEYIYTDLPITLINPTKTGYVATGWKKPPEESTYMSITIYAPGDYNYKAVYRGIQYKVDLHKNDGSTASTSTERIFCTYDTDCDISNPFTRDGYNFLGWNSEPDGTGTPYDLSVRNLTTTEGQVIDIYAQWEERTDIPYAVKHYKRDADGNFSLDYVYNGTGRINQQLIVDDLKETYPGYTMIGAFLSDSGVNMPTEMGGTVSSALILPDGSRVISIYYRLNELRLTYRMNGGTLGEGNTVYSHVNDLLTPIDEPDKLTFVGGVYGGKVHLIPAIGDGINITKEGYTKQASAMWGNRPAYSTIVFNQDSTDIDADGFLGLDLSTSDRVADLYIYWTPEYYSIQYRNGWGDSLPKNYTIEEEVTIGAPDDIERKIFLGWSLSEGGEILGTTYTIPRGTTGNQTLWANWRDDYEAMQSMTSEKCAAMETNTLTYMKDARDDNVYRIGKLQDGNCWMLDTLKIANIEISSEDSDLPEDTTFTLPASTNTAFTEDTQNTPKLYVDPDPNHNHGVYYSYYTATAGWGIYGNDMPAAHEKTDAPQSICPKGWKLPNGGYSYHGDVNDLVDAYGSDVAAYKTDFPGFELDGTMGQNNLSVYDVNENGFYWTSTTRSKWFANIMRISVDAGFGFNEYKYWPYSVLCIAK